MIPAADQHELASLPIPGYTFLEGPAGSGKTTAAVMRLLHLIDAGVPGESILILLPQRTLGNPYLRAITSPHTAPSGLVNLLTAGGLAQRMVELFWPMVSHPAGFSLPTSPPTFLTLETAQYFMARLVNPLLAEGYFDSVVMDRNRLFSQILDNLNKSAVVGFPLSEIGDRLKAAWAGRPAQLRVYDDVQVCASKFRQLCMENNLLDFSLQVEVFWNHVWPLPACRDFLINTYRHIIFDNIEEDTPFAHNLLAQWLPHTDSALLVYDENAGFRRFLGADPDGAYLLKELCLTHRTFPSSRITSPPVAALRQHIGHIMCDLPLPPDTADPRPALEFHTSHFYPEMLDWVAGNIAHQIHDLSVPPSEIVILAPYLSDALRYGLVHRLGQLSVPVRSHRPSRSLREEPVTHALLTLARLAHPQWNLGVTKSDLAYALVQTIEELDLIRSNLLAEIVFRTRTGAPTLESFDQIIPSAQERITYFVGERYEHLRQWLAAYQAYPPLELDHFWASIFGEVLAQPGFCFHTNYEAGAVTARLIESVQKFRRVATDLLASQAIPVGQEYIHMVDEGVIAAQYLESWSRTSDPYVLLAPAYTFLMSNYPVQYQYWLDISSRSWSERLSQPLTHPYVLSRAWPRDRIWSDADEVATSQDALYRLVVGLLNRCRQQVYLGLSDLGEQGFEQRGPLLRMINRILQVYVAQ